MGTDIHYRFETKVKAEQNQVATKADASEWVTIETRYEGHRHYLLFAVLAGVRNGYGFAGVYRHEPLQPIAEGRGLPPDLKFGEDEDWEFGDHSRTWVLGSEILEWAKLDRMLVHAGIISREQFESWGGKSPDSYCGGVSGPGVLVIDDINSATTLGCVNREYSKESQLVAGGDTEIPWTHIRVYWAEALNESIGDFLSIIREEMDKHGEIRMVMGFDS